jgi:UV DNA damage endonuclease
MGDRSNMPMPNQKPELGLVCMTSNNMIRFRELTRTRLLRLSIQEQKDVLRGLYEHNLIQLGNAVSFCKKNNIRLYRIYSNTFPFADSDLGSEELDKLSAELKTIGQAAIKQGLRLVSHPYQFVVLNSDREEVIENSIRMLQMHAKIFDLLVQPRSPWAACNIHPGKAGREERLLESLAQLPDNIKSRLTLENDEYSYSAESTYRICMAAQIPMVFDAHHHVINQLCPSYNDPTVEEMCAKARETWKPNESWQLVHISNGCDSIHDRRHHDFIDQIPDCFMNVTWIEVEAKKKELAIEKLKGILQTRIAKSACD